MKNFICKNYNILVDKLFFKNDMVYFFVNNEKYYVIRLKDIKNVLKLVNITNNMYYNGIKVNTFIMNVNKEFYTKKDDEYITILRVNESEDEIDYSYLKSFFNINVDLEEFDILNNWINEVDSIEKELIEYNKEYPTVQKTVDYFIGCAENAIQLLNEVKNESHLNNNSIGHIVNYKSYSKCKMNNPFTFIKTNKVYDISNYIKYKFFCNKIDYNELDMIIENSSVYEKVLLFSCLLYPNYYFSLIKDILNEKKEEDELDFFIKNIKVYRKLLLYCQSEMKSVNIIQLVNWINN